MSVRAKTPSTAKLAKYRKARKGATASQNAKRIREIYRFKRKSPVV